MQHSERQLIAQAQRGRREAFGELVRRYQDRVFNLAYRLLGSVQEAEDVTQETFLCAFRALRTFRGRSQFFTWLYRIAVNKAANARRGRLLRYRRERDDKLLGDGQRPQENSPSRALEAEEEELLLQKALNQLSPDHRTVLVLSVIEGMKYEAIAETLHIPVGTVRSRLHRARLELREVLSSMDARAALGEE